MRVALFMMLSVLFTAPAFADGEQAGDFDYYVLALSWSPNWCLREGDARGAPECAEGSQIGWSLHGLWPQYEEGWPSYCRTPHREARRSETAAMQDIMGSAGLAWHQWKKHGRCTGLEASEYFALSRKAFEAIEKPQVLRKLQKDVRLPAGLVEQAFEKYNPNLSDASMRVTCVADQIQEVRVCLTKDLEPRVCSQDLRPDCDLPRALLTPLR